MILEHLSESLDEFGEDSDHPSDERMRRSLRAQALFFIKHPSPLLIGLLLGSSALVRLALGPLGLQDLLLALGVVAYWPAQEWFLHKYLLHLKPRVIWGRRIDPEFASAHRAHHRRPWRIETTFLPVRVVLLLIPITILAWVSITPSLALGFSGVVAYGTMALLYEWTHYLTHSAYVPRSAYFKRIWRNHRLHHFKNERYWFAFTIPHIDKLLRTDPAQDSVERSETVRSLGVDEP